MADTYEQWKEKLSTLNDYINVWNDYAESCQAEYDRLLKLDPRKLCTTTEAD